MSEGERSKEVVLVHGLLNQGFFMWPLAAYLRASGFRCHVINLWPCAGEASIEELAGQLGRFVDKHLGDKEFQLVGFSMGGLVSRYFIQKMGGRRRVTSLATIVTPHYGTRAAEWSERIGCIQMRCSSVFLNDLNKNAEDELEGVEVLTIGTPWDRIVKPVESSYLEVGQQASIWSVSHLLMLVTPGCWRRVGEFLWGERSDEKEAGTIYSLTTLMKGTR